MLEHERRTVAALQERASTIPSLHASVDALRVDLLASESRGQQQVALVGSLEQQLRDQIDQHAFDLKCSASVAGDLESELATVKNEAEQLQRKNKELKKKLDEVRSHVAALEARLAEVVDRPEPVPPPSKSSSAHAAEVERLVSEMMLLRRENATLSGKVHAMETMSSSEAAGLRARLNIANEEVALLRRGATAVAEGELLAARQALADARGAVKASEGELASARQALAESRAAAAKISRELEQLREDKEQLLQQVELLVENGSTTDTPADQSAAATITALTDQVSTLTAHAADLKSYLTRYKAAGDAKMSALSTTHAKLVSHASQLCQSLVTQGVVKRDNAVVYQQVQQIATIIKQPRSGSTTSE
jgi:chromosome segregation ATPase